MTTPLDPKTSSRLKHARAAMRRCSPDELSPIGWLAARAVLMLFPHGDLDNRTQHVVATVQEYAFTAEETAAHADDIQQGCDFARWALKEAYQPQPAN